jgi:hypothetical protein
LKFHNETGISQMRRTDFFPARYKKARVNHRDNRFRRHLSVEQLEDRRMLAMFTVTNLNDAPVAMTGSAPGTLRQAIFDANATNEPDVIEFQAGLTGTITLTKGQLDINKALSIVGPGAAMLTIDASGNDPTPDSTLHDGNNANDGDGSRIFRCIEPIEFSVSGVTLTGGDTNFGGAIRHSAYDFGGSLAIADTVITGNVATGGGGAIDMSTFEYGLENGLLNIRRSSISHNSSRDTGGAIATAGGLNIEIVDCAIVSNFATGSGGAIYHGNLAGKFTIIQSTISGNSSGASGGGIYSAASPTSRPGDDIAISHSVITRNTARSRGGGIGIVEEQLTLDHAIVAGNTSDKGMGHDLYYSFGLALSMEFSLLGSGKVKFDLTLPQAPVGMPDANGNLIGGAVDRIDPLLGPLADNGGPTMTHALMAGSPAIDAGDPGAVAGKDGVPEFDQRSTPFGRVVDGDGANGARIDIGPFELVPSAETVLPGDYNDDDVVDAADYVVWRRFLNTATELPNDATPGVNDSDYSVWRANFGNSLPIGSGDARFAASENDSSLVGNGEPIRAELPLDSMTVDSQLVATIISNLPTGVADRATGQSSFAAAVHLTMSDLATSRDAFDRRASSTGQQSGCIENLVERQQLLLLESVFEPTLCPADTAKVFDYLNSEEVAEDGHPERLGERYEGPSALP